MFCNADIPTMLNTAFQVAIRLGAILAVLRIAYAGYLYMGSEDMWSSKSAAKEAFRDAIVGLLILLAIWLILHQIDPRILSLKINFPAGGGAAQQQSQQNSSVFVAPSGNGTVIPSGQN
jgi:ABC-type nickel/cobalt efflux system permease component RcnA